MTRPATLRARRATTLGLVALAALLPSCLAPSGEESADEADAQESELGLSGLPGCARAPDRAVVERPLIGTWRETACAPPNWAEECGDGSSLYSGDIQYTAEWTFRSNGTFQKKTSTKGRYLTGRLSVRCLGIVAGEHISNRTLPTDELCKSGFGVTEAGKCKMSGGMCRCLNIVRDPTSETETGKFQQNGERVALTYPEDPFVYAMVFSLPSSGVATRWWSGDEEWPDAITSCGGPTDKASCSHTATYPYCMGYQDEESQPVRYGCARGLDWTPLRLAKLP